MKNTRHLILILLALSCFVHWGIAQTATQQSFRFDEFKIDKERIGSIKLGMTVSEAEEFLSGFRKEVSEAILFGFGGGSPAYLYYWEDEIVLGLIPALDTDTLLYLVAAHPQIKTTNGLNPNSSVSELLKKYPHLTVMKDLMNQWEFFQDKNKGWDFIFMTEKETEIGEYQDLYHPAVPKRLNTKSDWITIRKVD